MSNIDIYKDNYENRGTDISYKCRTAITFKVKVQVAIGYTAMQTAGWWKKKGEKKCIQYSLSKVIIIIQTV